jgi:Polyketide cyclase / dehydrase and lipid transport
VGRAAARQHLPGASVDEVQALWLDLDRWPAFVDGFGTIARREGEWPQPGARVVWDSLRNGRGRVVEQVSDHEPGRTHVVRVEDPQLRGTQHARFSAYDGGCEISLELDYALKEPGLGGRLTDILFVRRSLGDALRRTLRRFAVELEADRAIQAEPERPPPRSRNEKES